MDHQSTYTLLFYLAVLPFVDSFSLFKDSFVMFMAFDVNLNYQDATTICANYEDASLASLEQVNTSLQNGIEFCKWGWVKEQKIVMPRLSSNEKCGNFSLGVLIRDCQNMRSSYTYCFKSSETPRLLYDASLGHLDSSYENASLICALSGDRIATRQQIESTSNHRIRFHRPSWYDWGIGLFNPNGTFKVHPCQDTERKASAFCVRPKKKDQGCMAMMFPSMVGSMCVSSLLTGLLLKRKQVMSYMKKKPPAEKDSPDAAPTPQQTSTGTYQAINDPKESENVVSSSQLAFSKNAAMEKRQVIYIEKKVFKSRVYKNKVFSDEDDDDYDES